MLSDQGVPLGAAATIDPASNSLGIDRVRQVDANTSVGILDGVLTSIHLTGPAATQGGSSPTPATGLNRLHPASDWFPSARDSGYWIVTESTDHAACPPVAGTVAGAVQYRLQHIDASTGRVSGPLLLPCRVKPTSDSRAGVVAQLLDDHTTTGRPDGEVYASVVLLDPQGHVTQTVASHSLVVDAAADRLFLLDETCKSARCGSYAQVGDRRHVTVRPVNGRIAGAGILSPDGQYLASAAVSSDGRSLDLDVIHLDSGATKRVGTYVPLAPGAPGVLTDDMPSVWAGDHLIVLDASDQSLLVYDALKDSSRRVRLRARYQGVLGASA